MTKPTYNVSVTYCVDISINGVERKEIEIVSKKRKGGFLVSCPYLKCIGYSNDSFDDAKEDLKQDIVTNILIGSYIRNILNA